MSLGMIKRKQEAVEKLVGMEIVLALPDYC